MQTSKKLLFLTLLMVLSLRTWGQNPNYNFKFIAMNGQTIDGIQLSSAFNLTPCLNDADEVVFMASYQITPGNDGTALFADHHLIAKSGDTIDGKLLNGVYGCSLNNFGSILFNGQTQSGKSILFRKDRGSRVRTLAVSGEKIDGLELQSFSTYLINDLGQTVFSAYYKCGNGSSKLGIFTPDSVLVTPGSTVDHYLLSSIDSMIAFSSGRLYFHAFNTNIGEGIFSLHRLILKVGDTVGGFTFIPVGSSAFGYLAASANGRLSFGATYNNGGGIFTPHSVVATSSSLLPAPSAINNRGAVVYGGPNGLVINQTPLFSFGNSINGHILNGLAFPPSINDRGAVAFMGNFGPDAGIILATPKHH